MTAISEYIQNDSGKKLSFSSKQEYNSWIFLSFVYFVSLYTYSSLIFKAGA